MKKIQELLVIAALFLLSTFSGAFVEATPINAINKVLDDFHKAASEADGKRYFGHFSKNGVFIGTDARERWTVKEFKAYADPHFSKGKGWTYTSTKRNVDVSSDGKTAWFDEILENFPLSIKPINL